MRVIGHRKGSHKISRGKNVLADNEANFYFVDTEGSFAIVNGRLYRNGTPAEEGTYTFPLDDGETVQVIVDSQGKVAFVS